MIRVTGVVLLLTATGCATGGPPGRIADAPPTPAPVGHEASLRPATPPRPVAPHDVLGYTIADSVRYPQAEAGALYRYRGSGALSPDVYLYPRGADGTVDSDVEGYHRVLEVGRQRGFYDTYQIDLDRRWSPIAEIPGREVVTSLDGRQGARTSYYHIFTVQDQFVKVRITVPRGEVEADTVRAFVRALIGTFKP